MELNIYISETETKTWNSNYDVSPKAQELNDDKARNVFTRNGKEEFQYL